MNVSIARSLEQFLITTYHWQIKLKGGALHRHTIANNQHDSCWWWYSVDLETALPLYCWQGQWELKALHEQYDTFSQIQVVGIITFWVQHVFTHAHVHTKGTYLQISANGTKSVFCVVREQERVNCVLQYLLRTWPDLRHYLHSLFQYVYPRSCLEYGWRCQMDRGEETASSFRGMWYVSAGT